MIYVRTIGYKFANFGGVDINRKEGTGDYLFLYFRCPVEVMLDGEYVRVPKNTFIFYEKGKPQVYRKLDGHMLNDWLHFDVDTGTEYFKNLGIPFQIPIQLVDHEIIVDMFEDIYMEYFNQGEQHDYIMGKKVSILLHKFSDLYKLGKNKSSSAGKYFPQLSRIRREILNYTKVPESVEEVAAQLNLNTYYFQHLYKELFQESFHQDVIKGRIEHAARLLNGTDDSIGEIARACGYENLEHFSRQFKKIKGCSPSKYRNHK